MKRFFTTALLLQSFLAFLLLLMIWSKRRSRDYPINKIKEGDIRMLVYEHMVNRSLDAHLFRNDGTILNWSTRYQIAVGVAKGLSYLHESCHDCIIHCDIKLENILLDVSFVPKVADFGMAKLLGRDFSRVLTTMRGTVGYLVPEWISGVAITQKVDVYSYGMGDVGSLVDHQLQGDINMEEVERACKVACWCIQDEDFNRPTMGDVVQVLEGLVEPDMPQVTRLLESILGDVQEFKFDQISGISTE
uniref:Protein kinase domain-containing protein n=1 Tax=Oryza glumipatula TaxID=40148 RepID=A0A0E0AXE5_9ORYZ